MPREDFVRKLRDLEVCSAENAAKVFDSLKRNHENYLDFNSFHKGFKYSTLLDQSKFFEQDQSADRGQQAASLKDPRRPLSQLVLGPAERAPAGKRAQPSSSFERVQQERLKDIESMLGDKWSKAALHQSDVQIKYRLDRGGPVLPSAKVLSVYKSFVQDRARK